MITREQYIAETRLRAYLVECAIYQIERYLDTIDRLNSYVWLTPQDMTVEELRVVTDRFGLNEKYRTLRELKTKV